MNLTGLAGAALVRRLVVEPVWVGLQLKSGQGILLDMDPEMVLRPSDSRSAYRSSWYPRNRIPLRYTHRRCSARYPGDKQGDDVDNRRCPALSYSGIGLKGIGIPVVPPIANPKESVCMISNCSVWFSLTRYNVPPSALVMRFAVTRIVSSRRVVSVSFESAIPIWFNCSSRSTRPGETDLRAIPFPRINSALGPMVAITDSIGGGHHYLYPLTNSGR